MTTEAQKIVCRFIELLEEESQKTEPSIFPEESWTALPDLDRQVAQLTAEDVGTLADIILDWCENNGYNTILTALQKESLKCDPQDDDEEIEASDPSDQPITNQSLRSAIKTAITNQTSTPE
ncbi:hypothetical protein H6G20_23245 [Desertifilum sp. FACHB-1129]|uniref:Uncharacterized protein n=2 Tax=Desertifilum tharense IPPAS B-1220 TaxID=1781255 RepID=A0A1E5QHD0_9CYAN|nr:MULTISPECIES: hypothetical protein [Desertifilum]MDA0213448.1 hypothetical protein [Cyanobacteria bacterium FC1]MBD2314589.1 hypothetical protein [Desertifilum sp. FACHB-1129]MBD2322930.1 hypothetical protein [Desertifilum sp. FACHB-866]MBD2335179.1 hypothetical protein [Desertifilum sp. FACHB-868]OEJ74004.1 hypothetical protein BH720_16755 [Desertifilum tharense IPPAS B-1220]